MERAEHNAEYSEIDAYIERCWDTGMTPLKKYGHNRKGIQKASLELIEYYMRHKSELILVAAEADIQDLQQCLNDANEDRVKFLRAYIRKYKTEQWAFQDWRFRDILSCMAEDIKNGKRGDECEY